MRTSSAEYGCTIDKHVILSDDAAQITAAIKNMLDDGLDIDLHRRHERGPGRQDAARHQKQRRAHRQLRRAVLPGAMFLLAYTDDMRPVMGLPGCVMYSRRTIFDLVLPSIMADACHGGEAGALRRGRSVH